ncbi:hypothetical protein QR680_003537 [Steinernema hermaphroditum]|uniref:Uncharacterized protein n=1 Tax=Steinernema hermaphroditum TaxID=289476 RepID=A0AA39HMY7_9BILA|nr:hypothetical protein QR680_003537 [Steinernema hermaphroditum]
MTSMAFHFRSVRKKPSVKRLLFLGFCAFVIFKGFLYISNATVPLEMQRYLVLLAEQSSDSGECNVPRLDPWDPTILKYYAKQGKLECTALQSNVTSFRDGILTLQVNNEFRDSVNCKYRTFAHNNGVSDVDLLYSEYITLDNEKGARVDKEFVEVECVKKLLPFGNFYRYHHHQIVPTMEKRIERSSVDRPSVIMFGLDSMSRSNFERQMPRTHRALKEMGFVDMEGHVKVADNTYANWIAILTGKRGTTVREFPAELNEEWNIYFDDFPLIWKNYSANDYVTLFAEDRPDIGTFNYFEKLNGFKYTPTDHYFRPFWVSCFWTLGFRRSSEHCYQSAPQHLIQMNYLQEFIDKYPGRRKFAYHWSQDMSHDYLNLIGVADDDIDDFFRRNKQKFNDSIVIFFSDHGHRYDSIRETAVGRLESRLPYLSIRIPPEMDKKYPHLRKNLIENSKKMTTQFDLHRTLEHIVTGDFMASFPAEKSKQAHSLFTPISKPRTCYEAQVPEDFCPCFKELKIPADDAREAAQHLLEYANEKMAEFDASQREYECTKLVLERITDASVQIPPQRIVNDPQVQGTTSVGLTLNYRVALQAKPPSSAIIEAVVIKDLDSGKLTVTGEIERNNKYGNTSHCVADRTLKKICNCVKLK